MANKFSFKFFSKVRVLLAWLLVLINLAPIGWMIWCSLMGNNEILQGKILPDPLRNDVFFVDHNQDHFWAGTVNGQLYQYDLNAKNSTPKVLDLGEISSTWLGNSKESIWSLSADGGLSQIDPQSLMVIQKWDWKWIEQQYRNIDPTAFSILPGEQNQQAYDQLASRLNSQSITFNSEGKSLSKVVGMYFPSGTALMDSLNRILHNPILVNKVIQEWQSHENWFNPIIPWLMKQQRTELQSRLLFRWALAERFPGPAARFLETQWNEIWVNRIPASGHGTSLVECGVNSLCFALWWDEFPGIGVFSKKDNSVKWITLQHGLPSTAIQHLIPVNEQDVIAISDEGISLIDVQRRVVLKNTLYGEQGLKYLDGRDVRVAKYDSSQILLAYGQELVAYDFKSGSLKNASVGAITRGASDITALEFAEDKIYLGSSEGIVRVQFDSLKADYLSSKGDVFKGLFKGENGQAKDEVIHTISVNSHNESAKTIAIGGLFGLVALLDSNGKTMWNAQVPEGRFTLHWRNYQDLWKTIPFGVFLRNSLLISLSVMLISIVVAALASYALVRFEFPGKRLFNGMILSTQMVPGILYLIPIFVLFTAVQQIFLLPMVNTWHGIVLVYSAFFIPMSIWILRGYFASIPKELEEAALIDGCSPWGAFWKIVVPVAFPGIVATGIYVFLLAWDELLFAWVLSTDLTTATIPVGIRLYVGQFGNRFDLLMAAATVASLPVMLLFFVMQKHIVSGLTGGAVKG